MKKILLFLFISHITHCLFAQPVSISGNVISKENLLPLKSVSVRSSSGLSSVSDNKGSFSIVSKVADTLLFSLPGYDSFSHLVVAADMHNQLAIALVPLGKKLQEVTVNNGYQVLPKERSTGSFSYVDNKMLSEQVSTGILARLESVTNGLTYDRRTTNGKTNILIRGISTIQGPKEPLIILDNFPYSGDINNINPNDVESITVLKDAAATSIWGTRAGNGVIVITTKKGRFSKKLSVSLSSNISVSPSPDLFYLQTISPRDFVSVEQLLFSKGFSFADTAAAEKPPFTPVYEILFRQRSGLISQARSAQMLDSISRQDVRNDFNKYIYRSPVTTQTSLALQGGSANMAWRFSAGIDNNISTLHDTYKRITLTAANDFKITSRLQLSTGLFYTNTLSKAGRPGFGTIVGASGSLPPYTQLAGNAGNAIPVMYNHRQSYIDTAGVGRLLDWNYYPLRDYQNISNKTTLQNITGTLGLSYNIFKSLNLSFRYQYENHLSQNNIIFNEQSYTSRNLVNSYTQLNRQTGSIKYIIPPGSVFDRSSANILSNNFRLQLGYNKAIQNHIIAAILGAETREVTSNGNYYRTYGYNDDILTSVPVDYANTYPSFITGSQNFLPNNAGFSRTTGRFVSAYTNLGYTYKARYHLTASARKDASNFFGADANDKWNLLWSSGFAWDAFREKFYTSKLLPYLKLRATYGLSGNIDPSIATVSTIAYFSTSPYTGGPTAIFEKYKNPGLSWEKIATLNIGIDFKFRNDRITGSVEWYTKKGKDLYGTSPLDYTALPVDRLVKNVASMRARGLDVEVNTANTNKRLKWSTQLHFSINRDKVTEYHLSSLQGSLFLNGGNSISAIQGRPVYAVYSYRWAGLDSLGHPLGYLNGVVSKDYTAITSPATSVNDLIYHGRALPAFFGSLGNTFRFRNFYTTARLTYKFGYFFQKSTINYTSLFNNNTGHADFAKRWQAPGDEKFTSVPSMVYPASVRRDDFFGHTPVNISKGDHIRFQYLTFGYQVTNPGFKKLPLSSLNIFCNITNLGLLWRANDHGLDPDYPVGNIPPSSTYALGFNISFN